MTGADEDTLRAVLRPPLASDDKYTRGVVGIRTGSDPYPGAAVLGVEAAWRTGVGMVRYLGPERPTSLVLAHRPETVAHAGRVQAWVIGSGTDSGTRTDAETAALRELLAGGTPVVVDAGALDLAVGATAPMILTPHDREHDRLRRLLDLPPTHDRAAAASDTAQALGATVLLKGHRTIVASPDREPRVLPAATAWLATAGTGDVLAGVIGALTAARVDLIEQGRGDAIAAAGSRLHALAAARAVAAHEGGPITALDITAHLPATVGAVLGHDAHSRETPGFE